MCLPAAFLWQRLLRYSFLVASYQDFGLQVQVFSNFEESTKLLKYHTFSPPMSDDGSWRRG